jgi:hypothetical protein
MAQGGYQKPANPAPVSGPGQLARRTDGGPGQPVRDLPNPAYGEGEDFRAAESGAPMQGAQGAPNAAPGPAQGPLASPPIGLGEPTQNPNEPVTAGADSGPGPGMASLGLGNPDAANVQALLPYLPSLEVMAAQPNATPAFKNFVRTLRGNMPA